MKNKTFEEWYTSPLNVIGGNDDTAAAIRNFCEAAWRAGQQNIEYEKKTGDVPKKYRIENDGGRFILYRGDDIIFEVKDPQNTYTDDSIISAGLSIFSGLFELAEKRPGRSI